MWKKDDPLQTEPKIPRPEATPPRTEPRSPKPTTGSRATIGRSITIRGEVTGDEDLLIEGRVDGSVDLKQHSVTIGADGTVKADITARVVTVEGSVEGDLRADEQVMLRSTARVQGDITAPRVVLEDGATFRGGVDMGDMSENERRRGSAKATGNSKAAASSTSRSDVSPEGTLEVSESTTGATP